MGGNSIENIDCTFLCRWSFYFCHCCHLLSYSISFTLLHLTFDESIFGIKSIYKRIMVCVLCLFLLLTRCTFRFWSSDWFLCVCICRWFCFSFGFFWNLSMWEQLPHGSGCELFEIIIHSEGYDGHRFRNDLKLLFTQIGVRNQRTVVLFSMTSNQVS